MRGLWLFICQLPCLSFVSVLHHLWNHLISFMDILLILPWFISFHILGCCKQNEDVWNNIQNKKSPHEGCKCFQRLFWDAFLSYSSIFQDLFLIWCQYSQSKVCDIFLLPIVMIEPKVISAYFILHHDPLVSLLLGLF